MVRRSVRRFLASPGVDAFIRVMVVLSLPAAGFAVAQNRELSQCVAEYNNANSARSKAVSDAQELERAADRSADDAQSAFLLSPILNKPAQTPADRTELRKLFRVYQVALAEQRKERAAADDARREHPLPPPPSAVCG